MATVVASDTIRYQNNLQINSTTPTIWYKTQTIQITSAGGAISGTARFNYDLGINSGCYASPDGCIGTQIRKAGVTLNEVWPPDGTGHATFDLSINFAVGDIIELWVRNSDGNFPTWTSNFHISYDTPGSASFTSNPSGATIWVDGVNQGVTTPYTLTLLAPGSHSYTLKLTGYNDATGSFSVTSGMTTTVPTVTLTASVGSASFTSVPSGATIWIDGTSTGVTTPNTIANLSAGSHNYTLKLTGYADATGSFSVTGGATTTVPTVTFVPSLYITSTPSGASIYIDNILQGVYTPATITNLSIGGHTYLLTLAGYNVSSGNFTTTGGQTTNVSMILSGTATAFLTAGD